MTDLFGNEEVIKEPETTKALDNVVLDDNHQAPPLAIEVKEEPKTFLDDYTTKQTEPFNGVIPSKEDVVVNDNKPQDELKPELLLSIDESLPNEEVQDEPDPQQFDLFGEAIIKDELLRDKFIAPPFSVLDAKQPYWSQRKRKWKNLGLDSEDGRDAECMPSNFGEINEETGLDKYGRKAMTGVSIFDPALCEILYTWFCPKGGKTLDPFSGGSVRGIIGNYLGFKYTGIDLRQEQVDANYKQAEIIIPNNKPLWLCNDSDAELDKMDNSQFDFILSCPPYHDLEVYSDDPNDLSNMEYDEFLVKYKSIITKAVSKLKPNRFAVFVVGDVRDKNGFYKLFPQETINSFVGAGAKFYNDIKLLQPLGTAMLRANNIFGSYKKVIKVHEDVLVFYKGDPKEIKNFNHNQ